jgi:hypothetical protein
LTSFYGAVALICGLAAAFLYRRPRLFNTLLFMVAALAVAAPWLVRNFVLLGDPIYPLGTPPFDGKGIVEPLWTASKEEISRNALGYWAGSHGLWLRLRELTSALFDRQMLATGLYFGLLLGLTFRRREPVMAYLALVLLGLLVVVLVPGWFWLRSLVPAIPIAALLTGRVLSDLLAPKTEIPKERRFAESGLRTAAVLSVTAVLVASGLVGISLAVAGPNQYTWTTGLSEQDDLMRGVKNLGSPREQLWSTFTGDLLMWEWINHNVRPGERIGTLEFRTYYLDRPEDLFYLDGIEAVPLLKMSTPEQVSRFFNDQRVRYVALPSWSMHGPSSHPVKDLLPLFRMLGGAFFPTVATFAIGGSDTPSVVYSVGSTDKEPVIGVFPGSIGSSMTLEDTSVTIYPRRDDPRIFVPVSHERAEAVFLEYETEGAGRIDMNLFEPSTSSWREGVFVGERTGYPGVAQAILPLPPSNQAFFNLGFYVTGDPLRLRELRLVEPVTPLVRTAAGASIEDVDAQFELPPGDTEIRVFVPVGASGRAQLHISYFDGAGGSFDINQYNSDSREWTGLRSIPRRNTEKWKSFVLSIRSRRPGFVELGVFVRERPLQIQELTVD